MARNIDKMDLKTFRSVISDWNPSKSLFDLILGTEDQILTSQMLDNWTYDNMKQITKSS